MAEDVYQKTQVAAPKPKLGQAFAQETAQPQVTENAPVQESAPAQTNIPAPNVEAAAPQDTNPNV